MAKSKEKKIQDSSKIYSFLRRYVDFMIHRAYYRLKYIGTEKIPTDGAIIYSPNHSNALMDALVILSLDNSRKVFISRADLFTKPLLAKTLTFLKLMPVNRIRDGWSNLTKTNETLEKSADVLKDRVALCILPEGTHNAQHSLLPVGKGVFRMAFAGMDKINDKFPIYIVPVGIEYGNFFRYLSTSLVKIGDPINLNEYISDHKELDRAEIMNMGKDHLAEKMKDLILYIPRDEHYQAIWDMTAAIYSLEKKNVPVIKGESFLERKFRTNRNTLENIHKLREERPGAAQKLLDIADEFSRNRLEKKISLKSIIKKSPCVSFIIRCLIFLLTLPFFILSGILSILVLAVSYALTSRSKDKAFHNSIKFVVTLVIWPISMIIWGVLFFIFMPWEYALVSLIITSPSVGIVHLLWKNARLMTSDLKLSLSKEVRLKIKELNKLYSDLKQ